MTSSLFHVPILLIVRCRGFTEADWAQVTGKIKIILEASPFLVSRSARLHLDQNDRPTTVCFLMKRNLSQMRCHVKISMLKGLFHPAILARVVSSLGLPLFVAIFIGHEGRPREKRRHVQGMLDETDPSSYRKSHATSNLREI